MNSSQILIAALSVAVLALLAIMVLILLHRRKTEKFPPSRVAFAPIIITGIGTLFILALLLAKPPGGSDNQSAATKIPLPSPEPTIASPDRQPRDEVCTDRFVSDNDQGRYYIKKDICLTGQDTTDRLIAAKVTKLEKQFLQEIDLPEKMPQSIQFVLDIRTEESTFTYQPEIQSVKMTIDKDIGGAHPDLQLYTWTFDRLTDRLLNFDLLFQEDHDPLLTLYPLVKQRLMSETYADEQMIDAGTGDEKPENYRNFTIEDDQLVFYFAPGTVAPQAAGVQRVALPLEDIQAILRPPFLNLDALYAQDFVAPGSIYTREELAKGCEHEGGNWLAEHDECEYVGRTWCEEYEATFLECESACRHDPDAQICTMQCVPVCSFK